jgi:hypothetical protein
MQRRLLADVALTEKTNLLPYLYTTQTGRLRIVRKISKNARFGKNPYARQTGTGLAMI